MMSHKERAESRNVTLEDLLRLKRSERPAPEFWSRFEQELRAKQLAAIVEKRPWWISLRLPQVARYVARFQVPVGAAAALALSFVVVREYRPVNTSSDISRGATVTRTITDVQPPRSSASVEVSYALPITGGGVTHIASSHEGVASVVVPVVVAKAEEIQERRAPVAVESGGLVAMIPWSAQPTSASAPKESVTLGELSPVQFQPVVNAPHDHDFHGVEFEPIVMNIGAVAENDAAAPTVTPTVSPREVRRSRILSNLVLADNASDGERAGLVQVRDVIGSSLDDDRLYDNVRRIGMGGDRLTLKF